LVWYDRDFAARYSEVSGAFAATMAEPRHQQTQAKGSTGFGADQVVAERVERLLLTPAKCLLQVSQKVRGGATASARVLRVCHEFEGSYALRRARFPSLGQPRW
jgi:hypothetical protein